MCALNERQRVGGEHILLVGEVRRGRLLSRLKFGVLAGVIGQFLVDRGGEWLRGCGTNL